jgi:glycosyltransferase involved in cell wall biosynthesis
VSTRPTVSVVIPAFEAERYVGAAIESVLAQGYEPLEIVVVDDGSTDGTAAAVARYGDRVHHHAQEHAGIGAARNRGVALARGDLIAFLDADDLWAPNKLARQTAALAADPALDLVFGHVLQFVSAELDPADAAKVRCPTEAAPGHLPGTLLARREAFACVGTFATDCRVGEFVDWCARARERGLTERMLPETVLLRRIHTTNQGIRARDAQTDYVRIAKAALDRRRRAAGGGKAT